ncbi:MULTISPECIES: hypothetical protein [Spirulina sp. CCY15215]|uniref:hypothetical protein n=1 Tax=Spirulina sp. CCY15215 TaxID=2767591 RepID=UPI00195029F0|nr:hypothetical protein [Spirulina major]
MKQKILIIDTSILCEWLEIPGKHSKESEWNQERIDRKIEEEKKAGTQFLLPFLDEILKSKYSR